MLIHVVAFILQLRLTETRLRPIPAEDRLESLMILNCEKYIDIDYNAAIDTFAATSDLLKDSLVFK